MERYTLFERPFLLLVRKLKGILEAPLKIELPVKYGFPALLKSRTVELPHFLGMRRVPAFGIVHGAEFDLIGNVFPADYYLNMHLFAGLAFATFFKALFNFWVFRAIVTVVFQFAEPKQVFAAVDTWPLKVQ